MVKPTLLPQLLTVPNGSFFSTTMASPTAPLPSSFSLLRRGGQTTTNHREERWLPPVTRPERTRRWNRGGGLCVFGAQTSEGPQRPPPGVDTRIHWENEDEGWIGGSSNKSRSAEDKFKPEEQQDLLGEKFSELLNNSTDSHYQ